MIEVVFTEIQTRMTAYKASFRMDTLRCTAMKAQLLLLLLAVLGPATAHAVEYTCDVTRKVDSERIYSENDLRKGQFKVLIEETADATYVSRCSVSPSDGKNSCDKYKVDHTEEDKRAKIKKYYVFRSHFDVQLFSIMSFVENNGRGGIAFGQCRFVAP